ncbi:MAG TPA: sigma-70 family RNA polymerase sigma factor, partial [Thermopolyspora sp.]
MVEALRRRDPDAMQALYDAHAESVYRYCWSQLGGPDGAQVALRDTLIAAQARIHALGEPRWLRVWLFALARGECLRRRHAAPEPQAVTVESPVVYPAQSVVAADAVRTLSPGEREVLELVARHGLTLAELARVLGVAPRQARIQHEAATSRLSKAVAAQIAARRGAHDWADRPEELRQVSAAKVFGLLPQPGLPSTLRVRVMSCFADPDLAPYREYVARRVGPLDGSGFPVGGSHRWALALAGALAAVAAVALIALVFGEMRGGGQGQGGVVTETVPITGEPPGIRMLWNPHAGNSPMVLKPILRHGTPSPTGTTITSSASRTIRPGTPTPVVPRPVRGDGPAPPAPGGRRD